MRASDQTASVIPVPSRGSTQLWPPRAKRGEMIRANCRAAVAVAAIPFLLGTTSAPALATEGGGSQYPLGVETHFSGVMAPPGYHQFLYYSHYESSHSKDNNGDDNPRLAYFKIRTDAISTRVSYVWPNITVLGANVETRAALALPTIELSLGIAGPGPAARPQRVEDRPRRFVRPSGGAGLASCDCAPGGGDRVALSDRRLRRSSPGKHWSQLLRSRTLLFRDLVAATGRRRKRQDPLRHEHDEQRHELPIRRRADVRVRRQL